MTLAFFETASDLRRWFQTHHADGGELWIGFYKKATGRASVSYKEALDEALCFGWIDGVRRRVDDEAYTLRFTPRQQRSNWSAVNIARANELVAAGHMHAAGLAAFERRADSRSAIDSYEQRRTATLTPPERRAFKAHAAAWAFFSSQIPSYQRAIAHWLRSAKKDETRQRRLETVIGLSAQGRCLPPFTPRQTK